MLVLLLFVGVSIGLSLTSLTKAKFRYEETDGGMMLSEYIADKNDAVLEIGPVFSEDGSTQTDGRVVAVRRFALWFINSSSRRDVIPGTRFALKRKLPAFLCRASCTERTGERRRCRRAARRPACGRGIRISPHPPGG